MSGIVYMPKVAYRSTGNSSPQFTGSLTVATMTLEATARRSSSGPCGFNAVAGQPYDGGLVG